MGDWLVDYFATGLDTPIAAMPMSIFRIAVALSALWKFGYELRRGAWSWFASDSFIKYEYDGARQALPIRASEPVYRVMVGGKCLAAMLLLVGIVPRAAAAALALWFFFELGYDSKYHTTFLGMSNVTLAISDGTGRCLTYHTLIHAVQDGLGPTIAQERVLTAGAFGQVIGVLLVCGMYVGTAYRKLLSRPFMSGVVLHRWVEHMALAREHIPHREVWYPEWFVRRFALGAPADVLARRWRGAAVLTVVLEFLLPVALMYRPAWPVAAAVGTGMHLAFTVIYPVRLVPFSVSTVGAYVLFLPII